MGPVSFVMVLMGCGSGAQCEPISTLPVAYATQASCLDARAEIVSAVGTMGFARVDAQCESAVPASSARYTAPSNATS